MNNAHYDVVIIGAGLSGIGMACHLTRKCPDKTYAILERRQDLGGTWDLFKYPGIRSDSDMYTFGYHFRPWVGGKVLADGSSIKNYLRETAAEYGVENRIQYGLKVLSANWSSKDHLWQLQVLDIASNKSRSFTANFMVGCAGYYNQDEGYKPDFPCESDFDGPIIHPQHWPNDFDYAGKRVVVIGSGATAVTIVPAMAEQAEHVTMLQRSPTYLMSIPLVDSIALGMQRVLPEKLAYRVTRARNITAQRTLFEAAQRSPKVIRYLLQGMVRKQLAGMADMKHFTPKYNPWEERLCAVQDGDLFKAIKSRKADVVTDHIERFTKTGILLKSGQEIKADIIITATGLNIQMMGGVKMLIDGKEKAIKDTMIYRNVLVEGVPNAGMIFGYTNLPWTLKADIASEYICRLLQHMEKHGHKVALARDLHGCATKETLMGGLDSGYIKRAQDKLPRQGSKAPWSVRQHYFEDVKNLRVDPIEDGCISFDGVVSHAPRTEKHSIMRQLRAVLERA